MNKGDVVLTLFPFSDLNTIKCRPALIISSATYNKKSKDVVAVAISSVVKKSFSHDVLLKDTDAVFPQTGLKQSSLIKTGKIIHLEKTVIKRKLGKIDSKTMTAVNTQLKKLLNL